MRRLLSVRASTTTMIPAKALTFRRASDSRQAMVFIKEHHYTKTCPPGKFYYLVEHNGEVVGAAVFRRPSLPKSAAAYGADLELSRLVLTDACGKNSESRFLGFMLRDLDQPGLSKVLTFADPHHGHSGVIYRAANFTYVGMEKGHGTRVIVVDGVEMHSKTAYDRWGCSGAKLADLLPLSTVAVIVRPPKHAYIYNLGRSRIKPKKTI